MSDVKSDLIREYADMAGKAICNQVIEAMKSHPAELSGDDSELSNAWEEVCVQIQSETSVEWDAYVQTMELNILADLETLPRRDHLALWLQTDKGWNWSWDVKHPEDGEDSRSEPDVSSIPFELDDVVQYIISQYVLPCAESYTNKHIRSYLKEGDNDEEDEDDPIRERLIELMPLDTIVTDLWDWDIRFESESFDDIAEVAFGTDEGISEDAKCLADDFLRWIDEYDIDYNQQDWEPGEFENYIKEQCLAFMQAWRQNVKKEFNN